MAISINKVYNTVLSVLNKEQRGIITPHELKLLGKQVQLELVDNAFFDLSKQINNKNRRLVGSGDGDTSANIRQKLSALFDDATITFTSESAPLPADTFKLLGITSADRLTTYEEIERHQLTYLLSSPLTAPSADFPCFYYEAGGTSVKAYPVKADDATLVADYIRVPAEPRWGYTTNANYGNKVYDSRTFVSTGLVEDNDISTLVTDAASDHTPGTYNDVAISANTGSGTGAVINVEVSGAGLVNVAGVSGAGLGYAVGDILTISNTAIGGAGAAATITLDGPAIYDFTTFGSTDFELHESEETSLVLAILAYCGVVIRDPNITGLATQIIQSNEITKQ